MGRIFASAVRRPLFAGGADHLAHGKNALALEEHVLGAAKADAERAECASLASILRRVGVDAHGQGGRLRRPTG